MRALIEIYAVKIPPRIDSDLYNRLLKYLSMEKRERVNNYVVFEDSLRTLLSDILTRVVICKKKGVKNTKIKFTYNLYGKPYIEGLNLFFNISHSFQWIVCAIHEAPVGIDIEMIRPIDLHIIMKNIFSDIEYADLLKKGEADQLLYFYDLWTLKESYIKAIGKGLSITLNSFSIKKKSNDKIKIWGNELTCFFKQYPIDVKYKLSICSGTNIFPQKVNQINFFSLIRRVLVDKILG